VTPVRWRASARFRSLATVAVAGLGAALVTGHAGLVLLAAPALAALALMPRGRGPAGLRVTAEMSASRCFEGEEVTLTVTLASPERLDDITFHLQAAPGAVLTSPAATQTFVNSAHAAPGWTLRPGRWGRHVPATVVISCRYGLGGWHTVLQAQPGRLDVFPRPPRVRPRLVPVELLRRIGEHTGRAAGEGAEFSGLRPFVPGDRFRDINYPVSARRGQLHVNQRAASRAADLVIMIDAFGDVGPPGESTLDLAVQGAAGLVAAYLRTGDRVGVVGLGGMLRWLGPAPGQRQFYRIAEMMLDIRFESVVTPDLGRIPRTALPPGTLVVLFSPLLDERVLGTTTDLRQRGFPLIVVDVLRHEPPVSPRSESSVLALRLWRLDRAATRTALASLGVPVLGWPSGEQLDGVLAPVRTPSGRTAGG
jgi:uncharacterized protein (DUF58 family)